ncbi:MAG: M28 family peptidase [Acidobacteriota bacterium]
MDSKQMRNVLIVMAGVLFVWILSPLFGFRQTDVSISTSPLQFNAARAYGSIEEFVTRCPNRIFGSIESRAASGYLGDELEKLGYETDYARLSARIIRHKEVGQNVLGYKAGHDPRIIAEWGMLGAADLASRYAERDRIAAVLSLDNVATGDLAALQLDETGMLKGFTPPWYRMLALEAAEKEGLPVQYTSGLREHLARTFYIPWSDQGPFLNTGIPAINLASLSVNRDYTKAVYHTPQDTVEKLKISSVESFGQAAERIVRTLDELPSIPRESMDAFRLGHALFLGPEIILLLHTIVFLPLPFCLFFYFRKHCSSMKLAGLGREILAYFATLLPFLIIYFLIVLYGKLRMLPMYALYPATAKDSILENPSWGILGGIFGTASIIAALCILFYMFGFRSYPKQVFNISKPFLLCLLLVTAILALLHNSYWAVTFLTLPCWIWGLVGHSRHSNKRILHWIWILAAGLPCFAILWLLGPRFGISLNLIWYQILALSTGLFSATGYILGAAATAIGIRFMVIQLHSSG